MENFFTEDHFATQALNKMANDFHEGETGSAIFVDIMWGVDGIDKDGVDFFNASDIGKAIWDEDFDMSPYENQ